MILSIALEEELKVFDFVYLLFVFDCFPLLLHYLIFLNKFILWQKFFCRQEAEDSGMEESVLGRLHRVQLGGIDPVPE